MQEKEEETDINEMANAIVRMNIRVSAVEACVSKLIKEDHLQQVYDFTKFKDIFQVLYSEEDLISQLMFFYNVKTVEPNYSKHADNILTKLDKMPGYRNIDIKRFWQKEFEQIIKQHNDSAPEGDHSDW